MADTTKHVTTRVWVSSTTYGQEEYGVLLYWGYEIDSNACTCTFWTENVGIAEYDATNGMSGCKFDTGSAFGTNVDGGYEVTDTSNWKTITIEPACPATYWTGNYKSKEYKVSFNSSGKATAYLWWWCYPNSSAPSVDIYRPRQWNWTRYKSAVTVDTEGTVTVNSNSVAKCTIEGYVVTYKDGCAKTQIKEDGTALQVRTGPSKSATTTKYTVTCSANGGNVSDVTKTGKLTTSYTFSNWVTSAGTAIVSGGNYTGDHNTVLTPKYSSSTTDGGVTLPTLSSSVTTASIPIYFNYNYDNKGTYKTINSTATTTQAFSKWNTKAAGTGTSYNAGTTYKPGKDKTLYAVWGTKTTEYTHITTPAAISRTNYTFLGWNTKADGTGETYTASTSIEVSGSMTLYAKWQLNSFTVTLDKQGGTGGTNSLTVIYNNTVGNVTIPTKTGNIFLGYYDQNGNCYINAEGQGIKKWTQQSNGTLYAYWTAVKPLSLKKEAVTKTLSSITVTATTPAYISPTVSWEATSGHSSTPVVSYNANTRIATITLTLTVLNPGTTCTGKLKASIDSPQQSSELSINETAASSPQINSIDCSTNLNTLSASVTVTTAELKSVFYVSSTNTWSADAIEVYNSSAAHDIVGVHSLNLITSDEKRQALYRLANTNNKTLYLIVKSNTIPASDTSYSTSKAFVVQYATPSSSDTLATRLVPTIKNEFFNSISDIGRANYKYDSGQKLWLWVADAANKPLISSFIPVSDNTYYFIATKSIIQVQFNISDSTRTLPFSGSLAGIFISSGNQWKELSGSNSIYTLSPSNDLATTGPISLKFKIQDSRGFYSNEIICTPKISIQYYTPPVITAKLAHNWDNLEQVLLKDLSGSFTCVNNNLVNRTNANVVKKPQVQHDLDIDNNNTITLVKIYLADGETPVSSLTAPASGEEYSLYSISSDKSKFSINVSGSDLLDENTANDTARKFQFHIGDRFQETIYNAFLPAAIPIFNKQNATVNNTTVNRFGFNTKTSDLANSTATFTFKTENDTNGFVIDNADMKINGTSSSGNYKTINDFMNET